MRSIHRLRFLLLVIAALQTSLTFAGSRQWTSATPAAGVQIRSAPNFRIAAVSTGVAVSIDLFQVNADGSSTKLDTVMASGVVNPGAGTYVTHNLQAVYWNYSTPPAATASAPPVSVTIINDVPTVPLTAIYYPTPPKVPLAAGDPSLLLNLDLRTGAPQGWSVTGTGTFDAVNGYTAGVAANSGVANAALVAFASAAALTQGSVIAVFARAGVTIDDSIGTSFWDSSGDKLNATNRQLLMMRSNSAAWGLEAEMLDTAFPQLQIKLYTPSMSTAFDTRWAYANSHYVAGYQDPTFATLVFTWFQNQYDLFFDGHLIAAGALGDTPILQMFQNICLGNSNVGGVASGVPFGPYGIQQVQISNRFLGPVMAGPVLGLIPDSFATAYTSRGSAVPTGPNGTLQVSDVDAVQTARGLYTGIPALFGQPGQTSSFHQIQALMFQNYGFFPPIYNAGHPGHGYALAPMDDAYIAALNLAAPTVVMAGGTVNDVSPFTPADGVLIADTENFMNRLSQGGGARLAAAPNLLLEQIVYLETLSSQALPSAGGYPEPGYGNESQNIITLTRTQLPAFRPVNGVAFNYVTSREWWNEAVDYASYLYGSAPADRFNGIGGKDYLNPHPDASGYSVIAAHLYPSMRDAVVSSAGVDLAIQSTPLVITGTSEGFSLNVSNAGPLTAAGVLATSVLPSGVTLVAGSSSPGCSQTGNTLTCKVANLAAGAKTSLNIQLQAVGTPPTSFNFSVGDSNGSDTSSLNNSTSVVPPGTAAAPPTPTPTPAPAPAPTPAPAVPAAPTALQANAGAGSASLSWIASAGAITYSVYSGNAPGAESSTPLQVNIAANSVVINGLTAGDSYYFVVRAVDAAGQSAASNEVSAVIPASQATAPAAAQAPSSTGGGGGAGIAELLALGLLTAMSKLGASLPAATSGSKRVSWIPPVHYPGR